MSSSYPNSEVKVNDPVILNPSPSQDPLVIKLYEQLSSDLFSLLAITASATMVWVTGKLKGKINEISSRLEKQEDGFLDILPEDEVARIREILAQLAILYDADRVTLGVFHNGVIGAKGAHYDKVAILASYSSPGIIPLPELNKDVNACTLMEDFQPMLENEPKELFLDKAEAPYPCSLYMTRRDIFHLWNVFLTREHIDLGVISVHWCSGYDELPLPPPGTRGDRKAKDLIDEITSIIQMSKNRKRLLG